MMGRIFGVNRPTLKSKLFIKKIKLVNIITTVTATV